MASVLHSIDCFVLTTAITLTEPLRRFWRWFQMLFNSCDNSDTPTIIYFHSSGLFLPYHIGVAEYMKANFDCRKTTCIGVSGGYAGASTIVLDLDPETHWQAISGMRQRASQRWLGSLLLGSHDMIHCGYLPLLRPEVLRKLRSGRFRLGCTKLWPYPLTPLWVSSFDSVKALCYACTCSMRVFPIFRMPGRIDGSLVLDGFLGCQPGPFGSNVIEVSAVPCASATVAPAQVLGGLTQVITLPNREDFDAWRSKGWADADSARSKLLEAGLRLVPEQQLRSSSAAARRARSVTSRPRSGAAKITK